MCKLHKYSQGELKQALPPAVVTLQCLSKFCGILKAKLLFLAKLFKLLA